jgi:hypothetical protein
MRMRVLRVVGLDVVTRAVGLDGRGRHVEQASAIERRLGSSAKVVVEVGEGRVIPHGHIRVLDDVRVWILIHDLSVVMGGAKQVASRGRGWGRGVKGDETTVGKWLVMV